jgi:hypothetical protein
MGEAFGQNTCGRPALLQIVQLGVDDASQSESPRENVKDMLNE